MLEEGYRGDHGLTTGRSAIREEEEEEEEEHVFESLEFRYGSK
jgi:hypothetical protein